MMTNPTQYQTISPAKYGLDGLFYDRERKAVFQVSHVRRMASQFGGVVIVDMLSTDRAKKQQFTLDYLKDLMRTGSIQRAKQTSDGVGIE